MISVIAGKKPHHITGKLLLPEREKVDAITKAFGDPIAIGRAAAGYASPSGAATGSQLSDKLLLFFNDLPGDQQEMAFEIVNLIWRQHQINQAAASAGKSPPTLYPPAQLISALDSIAIDIDDEDESVTHARPAKPGEENSPNAIWVKPQETQKSSKKAKKKAQRGKK